MMNYQVLEAEVQRHPYPILFATISGAHLYGFPSPDSDYDIRGTHTLPLRDMVGLLPKQETVSISNVKQGIELDLVTHDIQKFFLMMLKRNGYVLEQLYSPLVITSGAEHEELKSIGLECITASFSSLPRLRQNSIQTVIKRRSTESEAALVRLPGTLDRHTSNAHRSY